MTIYADPALDPLGPYGRDVRLVNRDSRSASFYGHRCDPAVWVAVCPDYIDDTPGEVRYEVTTHPNGLIESSPARSGGLYTTAAQALANAIGPPILDPVLDQAAPVIRLCQLRSAEWARQATTTPGDQP